MFHILHYIFQGFVADRNRNYSLIEELEEELNQYDAVISTLLEQLEKLLS